MGAALKCFGAEGLHQATPVMPAPRTSGPSSAFYGKREVVDVFPEEEECESPCHEQYVAAQGYTDEPSNLGFGRNSYFLRLEMDKAEVTAHYPEGGYAKWWPVMLEIVRISVTCFFFAMLSEVLAGIDDMVTDLTTYHWLFSTIAGNAPFYDASACRATMFDIIVSDAILIVVVTTLFMVSLVKTNRFTVLSLVSREGITVVQSSEDLRCVQILFDKTNHVMWEPMQSWRYVFGPTYRPESALWIGATRLRETEEFFQASTSRMGQRITDVYRTFPAWFPVFLKDFASKSKAMSLMRRTELVGQPVGLCCGEPENSLCMCCVRAPAKGTTKQFKDFVHEFDRLHGAPLHEWTGTLFSWFPKVTGVFVVVFILTCLISILRLNSFSHSWIRRQATATCGVTFDKQVITVAVITAVVTLFLSFGKRGRWSAKVQVYDDCFLIRAGRIVTKVRWADVESVHSAPCFNVSGHRPTSLVLQVNGFEQMLLKDELRPSFSCCCCGFLCLDDGICGIFYMNATCAKTKSTAPGTFIEVPGMADEVHHCAAFCEKFAQPEAYMDWSKTDAFLVM